MNYGFEVIPGITLKPVMEYVVSPNNFPAVPGSKQPSDAWIVGVQVAINVGEMFHFPQFVAH